MSFFKFRTIIAPNAIVIPYTIVMPYIIATLIYLCL